MALTPAQFATRTQVVNLQGCLGKRILTDQAFSLRAIQATARKDPRLRRMERRNALSLDPLTGPDPVAAAHTLAQLTVDKALDTRVLSRLAANVPTLQHLDVPNPLSASTRSTLTKWLRDLPTDEASDTASDFPAPLPFPDYYRDIASERVTSGIMASTLSTLGRPKTAWPLLSVATLLAGLPIGLLGGPLAGVSATLSALVLFAADTMRRAADAHRNIDDLESALARRTLAGDVTFEHLAAFLHGLANDDYDPPLGAARGTDIASLIAASRGPGGSPRMDRDKTWQGVCQFANAATILSLALQHDREHGWDRCNPIVSLMILHGFQWLPRVFSPSRLDDLRNRQANGERLIFVANHRSYLDIPALSTLLNDFTVRIMAKQELGLAPWLGRMPFLHPYKPWHWFDDGSLIHCLMVERSSAKARAQLVKKAVPILQSGKALLTFGPGTRTRTPVPGQEAGIAPFRTGFLNVAHAATEQGERVTIVPIFLYGTGSMFDTDYMRTYREGVRINQSTLLAIGKPMSYAALDREWMRTNPRHTAFDRDHIRFLSQQVWGRYTREFLPIQRQMREMAATEPA
jgi:1-acyl-sn-glycerol-3-phosphate acyltransferase